MFHMPQRDPATGNCKDDYDRECRQIRPTWRGPYTVLIFRSSLCSSASDIRLFSQRGEMLLHQAMGEPVGSPAPTKQEPIGRCVEESSQSKRREPSPGQSRAQGVVHGAGIAARADCNRDAYLKPYSDRQCERAARHSCSWSHAERLVQIKQSRETFKYQSKYQTKCNTAEGSMPS